jgi:hypothetical protein
MLPGVAEFVVHGVTIDGEVFRQADWAQHLCNKIATSGPEGLLYSSYVRPVMVDGVMSVVVRVSLELVDEKAFEMIKQYVAEHRLQVRAGRGSRDAEENEPLEMGQERRSPANNDW